MDRDTTLVRYRVCIIYKCLTTCSSMTLVTCVPHTMGIVCGVIVLVKLVCMVCIQYYQRPVTYYVILTEDEFKPDGLSDSSEDGSSGEDEEDISDIESESDPETPVKVGIVSSIICL